MTARLSVTEARRRLLEILRTLEKHPDRAFEILRHGKVVARVVSSSPTDDGRRPWSALLRAAASARARGPRLRVSEEVDAHLVDIAAEGGHAR